eukprot:12150466-Ditylum_brightwellii.AAC.1
MENLCSRTQRIESESATARTVLVLMEEPTPQQHCQWAKKDHKRRRPTISTKAIPVNKESEKAKSRRHGDSSVHIKPPVASVEEDEASLEDKKLTLLSSASTITEITPDVRTKEMKGDMKEWVQVDVVSVDCKPMINLDFDKFKEDETEIQFAIRKK